MAGVDCWADEEAGIAAEVSHGAVCLIALLQHGFVVALMQHDFLLVRIRLTRMAAERGPILSGACGQMNGFQSLVCTRLSVFEPPQ